MKKKEAKRGKIFILYFQIKDLANILEHVKSQFNNLILKKDFGKFLLYLGNNIQFFFVFCSKQIIKNGLLTFEL